MLTERSDTEIVDTSDEDAASVSAIDPPPLRVARTIADLEGSASVPLEQLNTAVGRRAAPTDTTATQA